MEQEQNRAELLNKLRSRMNQSKMGRLNKNQKDQQMTQMKEKIVGDNPQMAEIFDNVVKKTVKNKKKQAKKGLSKETLQKDLEKTFGEELNS